MPVPSKRTTVMWRYHAARLSRPSARRAFGRAWLAVCVVGGIITLGLAGGQHLFIVATIWLVCIFLPVRIAVESLHAFGPRLHDALRRDVEHRPDRYRTRERLAVMVELLYEREVRLPRLVPPDLAAKVIDAAVGLCHRVFRGGAGSGGVLHAATTCGTLLDRWVGAIAAGERGTGPSLRAVAAESGLLGASNGHAPTLWDPAASIQDQWIVLRAIAGLGALTRVLVAVYEDSAGQRLDGGQALCAAADAAMDYADQIGLRLDGPPWENVAGTPRAALSEELIGRLAETWMAFCQAPSPAPSRLNRFVETVPE